MSKRTENRQGIIRILSLALSLYAFWLALSGHYTPFLLVVGAVCTALCVYVAARMGTLDAEGHPVHLIFGALSYIPWLIYQITTSALTVTRIILTPKLPISPTMTSVKAGQKTPAGVCIYANSITLTPGTITVRVARGDQLSVHALTSAGADDLETGMMDARATRFEGA